MRHLRDDTVLILDGEVRVYRRERSKRWQAAFSIDGKPIRICTAKKDLNEAKEIARDNRRTATMYSIIKIARIYLVAASMAEIIPLMFLRVLKR